MPTSSQDKLLQQLIDLTAAVRNLAEAATTPAPAGPAPSHAESVRQRVAFSYRALGALTGRVSSSSGREFDVPVVIAVRRSRLIGFLDLPAGAHWAELRRGTKVEVLPIDDLDPRTDPADLLAEDRQGAREQHRPLRSGVVRPRAFTDAEAVGSVVLLRTRRGPLLAFGPRLQPVDSDDHPRTPDDPMAADHEAAPSPAATAADPDPEASGSAGSGAS